MRKKFIYICIYIYNIYIRLHIQLKLLTNGNTSTHPGLEFPPPPPPPPIVAFLFLPDVKIAMFPLVLFIISMATPTLFSDHVHIRSALVSIYHFRKMEEVLNGYLTNPNPTLTGPKHNPNRNPNSDPNHINEKKIQKETTLEIDQMT